MQELYGCTSVAPCGSVIVTGLMPHSHRPASLTINVGGDLPKDGQVGVVDHTTEKPLHAFLVVNQDGLLGNPEGHHPHCQQEEEEEDILHLQRYSEDKSVSWSTSGRMRWVARSLRAGQGRAALTMRFTMMILGPSVLLTVKMCIRRRQKMINASDSMMRPGYSVDGISLGTEQRKGISQCQQREKHPLKAAGNSGKSVKINHMAMTIFSPLKKELELKRCTVVEVVQGPLQPAARP